MTRPSLTTLLSKLAAPLLHWRRLPDFPVMSIAEARAVEAARLRALAASRSARGRKARRVLATAFLCVFTLPWTAGPLSGPAAGAASAQAAATPASPTEDFTAENAILDTAIPFAIGARQAEQALRGSFGWSTFQEGVVEGVYFRFDPDGYARFAPTPRLDSDVFEVICKPGTRTCIGRKGPLTVLLTARGQIQLQLEDTRPGDRFFVAEGVTEIELPPTILQPLEPQMELLLAAGGELLVRRGETEAERISLTGFYPVTAYLRWVAAGQDYSALPRGWPVPAAVPAQSITRPAAWSSPMQQPQSWPVQAPAETAIQPVAQTPDATREVAEVRGELRALRELLLRQTVAGQSPESPAEAQDPANADPDLARRIAELQAAAARIQADLARLTTQQPEEFPAAYPPTGEAPVETTPHTDLAAAAAALGLLPASAAMQPATQAPQMPPRPLAGQYPSGSVQTSANSPRPGAFGPSAGTTAAPGLAASAQGQVPAAPGGASEDERGRLIKRLEYLVTEIGLDPKTALAILESATPQERVTRPQPESEGSRLYRDDVVQEILDELDTQDRGGSPRSAEYRKIAEFLRNSLD